MAGQTKSIIVQVNFVADKIDELKRSFYKLMDKISATK